MNRSHERKPIFVAALLALFTLACVAALWISPAGLLRQQAVAQTRWRA